MLIDKATSGDLKEIAEIQVASWQSAYRGLVSDAFLDGEVPGIMARKWAHLPGDDWMVLVARDGGRVAGFAALEMTHEGGPYVDNLHVRPEARGRGVGRALMAALAAEVLRRGGRGMWLTVIRENAPTRAFYRAIGGVEGPDGHDDLFGQKIMSRPVAWDDLSALAALGAR